MLSIGEDEKELEIPDINLFRLENVGNTDSYEMIDMEKLLAILDVNSLTEDAVLANVLRKKNNSYGVLTSSNML
ncbi:TPR domain protein [Arachis hypogaea]|nr:TPR domain protein [Arachis hypogaea]